MADITMCVNQECPKRSECYRATAPFNPFRQSVAAFEYTIIDGEFHCDNFSQVDTNSNMHQIFESIFDVFLGSYIEKNK